MEEVWLKTVPIHDKSVTCYSIKSELGIDIAKTGRSSTTAVIKEEKEWEAVSIKGENSLEKIECLTSSAKSTLPIKSEAKPHAKRKPKTTSIVKEVEKKSDDGVRQTSQLEKKWYACEECVAKFATKVALQRHQCTHSDARPYVCDECGKAYSRSSVLIRHKLLHSGEKPHICSECGKGFVDVSTLKSHRLTHTGERPFVCEECGAKFVSKFYLQIHQRTHTGERPFVCDLCCKGFVMKRALARHKLDHSGEKPFGCDECEMRFVTSYLLKSHKKTHTDGKPFSCVECGKGFYHSRSLNVHKLTHLKEKPFGCEVCAKRFTQKSSLKTHKVIHSGERPFGCDECGMRFTQSFTLKTHQMKQHGSVPTSTPKHVIGNGKISFGDGESMRSLERETTRSTSNVNQQSILPTNDNALNGLIELEVKCGPLMHPTVDIRAIGISSSLLKSESIYEVSDQELNEFEKKNCGGNTGTPWRYCNEFGTN